MKKCKRNIILIFVFILIVNSLFFPCKRIHYGFHYGLQETEEEFSESDYSEWFGDDEMIVELYKRLLEIETEKLLYNYSLKEFLEWAEFYKIRRVSSEYVKVFFPLVKSRANKYKAYVKWEFSLFLLILGKKNETRTEKEKIYHEKIKEFQEKFGYEPSYHQILDVMFFIELQLLILMGVFAYIIFCVELKKSEKRREQ